MQSATAIRHRFNAIMSRLSIVASIATLAVTASFTSAAAQECHDCHYPDPDTGCVQCVHFTETGFTDCNQPTCDNCNLGGWCQEGLAQAILDLPREEALELLSGEVRAAHIGGARMTQLVSSVTADWDLKLVRGVLAEHGLFVSGDGSVVTCQGKTFTNLPALVAEGARSAVKRSATTL